MVFLGLQNIDIHYRYRYGSKGSISAAMVGTTLGYLTVCFCCIVWSKVAPVVLGVMQRKRVGRLLDDLGMQYSASTSLYRLPFAPAADRDQEDEQNNAVSNFVE